MSVTDDTTIHVGDPIYTEEIRVTRGDHDIYLIKYDDDTTYVVHDENGTPTKHTWRGDVAGASDFIAISSIFDAIYGGDA